MNNWTRREFIAAGATMGLLPARATSPPEPLFSKEIPATGETIPVIGLGTYNVLDVASTPENIATSKAIIDRLTDEGGSVIDTSPMYNRSEGIIGDVIGAGSRRDLMFLATKVWTDGREAGLQQMRRSAKLMDTKIIDLMQVHNLRDTAIHMETIGRAQEEHWVRYSGLTHYTAGAHGALMREMQEFKPQFIQINYSLGEREAEDRVLPMAADLGIAVIINRPFQAGRLFRAVSGKELPDWATEFAESWGQFFLKFIISHPAVTCVIPATSKPHHMLDNLGAGHGIMPDAATRGRMVDYFKSL